MTVKTSISLTNEQEAYARGLVKSGQFATMSSVLQRGLDMLREHKETHEAELEALRSILNERRKGPFIGLEEGRTRTEARLREKRATRGL